MSTLPTPIRVMLGLAATAAEEAKKLPETLPNAMTTVPMIAVSTAMQASLRVQQHIAVLAAKGDDVLQQLRGSSEEAPAWATFDDPPAEPDPADDRPQAAFDRIDYEHTGFTEGDDGARGRWDAVGVADEDEPAATDPAKPATKSKPAAKKASAKSAAAPKPGPPKAATKRAPKKPKPAPPANTPTADTPTANTPTAEMPTAE